MENEVILECMGGAGWTVVRYGWTNVPAAGLFGKDGLPAGPFRFTQSNP